MMIIWRDFDVTLAWLWQHFYPKFLLPSHDHICSLNRFSKSKLGYSVKKLVPKQFYVKCVVKHTLKLRKKSSITKPVGNRFFSTFIFCPLSWLTGEKYWFQGVQNSSSPHNFFISCSNATKFGQSIQLIISNYSLVKKFW